jgi:hypothetical protein
LDDFIAIERTIMGLINRDLIVDFQAILSTWECSIKCQTSIRKKSLKSQTSNFMQKAKDKVLFL